MAVWAKGIMYEMKLIFKWWFQLLRDFVHFWFAQHQPETQLPSVQLFIPEASLKLLLGVLIFLVLERCKTLISTIKSFKSVAFTDQTIKLMWIRTNCCTFLHTSTISHFNISWNFQCANLFSVFAIYFWRIVNSPLPPVNCVYSLFFF